MLLSLFLSLSILFHMNSETQEQGKGRVRKIKGGSNKLMGCVYMKCFSIMPLALWAKNKSFAIHWFQSLYLIMIYDDALGEELQAWKDFTHSHVTVYEYFCFCFCTGQRLKHSFRYRITVQYLTSKDPIMVPDTLCVRRSVCVYIWIH